MTPYGVDAYGMQIGNFPVSRFGEPVLKLTERRIPTLDCTCICLHRHSTAGSLCLVFAARKMSENDDYAGYFISENNENDDAAKLRVKGGERTALGSLINKPKQKQVQTTVFSRNYGTFAPGSKIPRTFAPTPSDFRSRHSFMDMYAYAVASEF